MHFPSQLITAILILGIIEPTYADSTNAQQMQTFEPMSIASQKIKKSFEQSCPSMTSSITNGKDETFPKGTDEAVCACAAGRTFSDAKVMNLLNNLEDIRKSPDKALATQEYLGKKLLSSLFSCFSENLNAQLNNANLKF